MARLLLLCDEIYRSLRKQRVFRDRTTQLDSLTDTELISRYRMPRDAIITLVTLVTPMLVRPTQRSRPLSLETQVLVTFRYLGKGGFLSEIGDLHGVSEASVSRSFDSTVNALCTVLNNISFPWNKEAQVAIKQDFYKLAGFPQVIGAIDGTQIPIKRPNQAEEMAFVCRKGYHSINVQAVCDANLRCLHKSTGCLWFAPDKCASIIMAAFKLHNYCIDQHVPNPPLVLDQDQDQDMCERDNVQAAHPDGQTVRRRLIAERFTH